MFNPSVQPDLDTRMIMALRYELPLFTSSYLYNIIRVFICRKLYVCVELKAGHARSVHVCNAWQAERIER